MRKIRDVLRLTHAMGMSRRLVGEATGIGKTAVGEYVRRAAVAGLSWPIPDAIDDGELERRLFPPTDASSSAARAEPDWSHIHAELKRRGVTLALLWQEYRAEHAQSYAYSWFCEPTATGGSASRRRCGRRMWRARSCSSTGPAIRSRCSMPRPGKNAAFVAALGAPAGMIRHRLRHRAAIRPRERRRAVSWGISPRLSIVRHSGESPMCPSIRRLP